MFALLLLSGTGFTGQMTQQCQSTEGR